MGNNQCRKETAGEGIMVLSLVLWPDGGGRGGHDGLERTGIERRGRLG